MQQLASIILFSLALTCAAKSNASSWACPLKSCVLNSPLAAAGPAFQDITRFNSMTAQQKSGQEQCPFGGDDGKEATKKEWKKYMKELDYFGDMSPDERRQWAVQEAARLQHELQYEEAEKAAEPVVNVSEPGIESLNRTTYTQLRNANKFDMLVAFYAPWCPHCKAFILDQNAPIKALSASLEKKVNAPKVVTFDITASDAPEALGINAVPTIYLMKTSGEAIQFNQNFQDLKLLMAFALGDPVPGSTSLIEKPISRHLRQASA